MEGGEKIFIRPNHFLTSFHCLMPTAYCLMPTILLPTGLLPIASITTGASLLGGSFPIPRCFFLFNPRRFHHETIFGKNTIPGRAKMAISGTGRAVIWITSQELLLVAVSAVPVFTFSWASKLPSAGSETRAVLRTRLTVAEVVV